MFYRCLNNPFFYCATEPSSIETQEQVSIQDLGHRQHFEMRTITRCKLNPKTCGYCQTFSENLAQTPQT